MKKKIKRVVSLLLAVTLLVTGTSNLTSCGNNSDDNTINMGQWLALVNQAFGMESYTSETPFFKEIQKDSPYFGVVQTAAEWEVIDNSMDIDFDKAITYEQTLETLVNVGGFLSSDATQSEKIDYAIEKFDPEIRDYWMDREIEVEKAVELLNLAEKLWATATYDTPIEEMKLKEDVVDFSSKEITEKDFEIEGNTVKIPESVAGDIKEGDVYLLPTSSGNTSKVSFKAGNVTVKDGYVYIENSDVEPGLEDVYEELFIQETLTGDNSKIEVIAPNGNVIGYYDGTSSETPIQLASNNTYVPGANYAGKKFDANFEASNFKVALTADWTSGFNLNASVESGDMAPKIKPLKLKGKIGVKVSDLKVTNTVDYGIFKGLESASLKIDYKKEITPSISLSGNPVNTKLAPYNNSADFLTKLRTTRLKRSDLDVKNGAKTIKLCSIKMTSAGVASLCLDVGLVISVSGEVSLKITESGTKGIEYKNGNLRKIEESKQDLDVSVKGKVEAYAEVGPAVYVLAVKKKIVGIAVKVGLGVEASLAMNLVDSENHLIEESGMGEGSPAELAALRLEKVECDPTVLVAVAEQRGKSYKCTSTSKILLHFDTCVAFKVYFILRIGAATDSYLTDILKGKIKLEWEIFGSKNACLYALHVDNGDFASAFARANKGFGATEPKCTHKYTEFDAQVDDVEDTEDTESTESTEGTESSDSIVEGDIIGLETVLINSTVGKSEKIQVNMLPKGYTTSDLKYGSSNKNVVVVTNSGNISCISEGSAIITISTSDGKFKQYCAVTVYAEGDTSFTPLDSN